MDATDTMCLHLAVYNGNTESVRDIHAMHSSEQWLQMLCTRGNSNGTPLHLAIESNYTEIVGFIHQSISKEQWCELLKTPNNNDITPFLLTAKREREQILSQIKDTLPGELWPKLLESISVPGPCRNFLHVAAMNGNTNAVNFVNESLSLDIWYKLLQAKDLAGDTPCHHLAIGGNIQLFDIIWRSLEPVQWHNLVEMENFYNHTAMHVAALHDKKEIIRMIYGSVPEELWQGMLCKKAGKGITLLHSLAYKGSESMLRAIKVSVSNELWLLLLQQQQADGYTVLQSLAYHGSKEKIDQLKELVAKDDWFTLCNTRMPLISMYNMYYRKNRAAVQMIADYRTEATVDKVIRMQQEPERSQLIQRLVEREPLTMKQIQQLTPLTPTVIIPYNQKNCKRYGLILFSSDDRPGAEDEADNLNQGLKSLGCQIRKHDISRIDLTTTLEDTLRDIADDCALLVVCLMSHGGRGALEVDGQQIAISAILQQITYHLPESTPVIVLIQACQASPTFQMQHGDSGIVQPGDEYKNQHIDLVRGNTVLLLATVRGGIATRGAFTGAMADQFRSADGKRDIYEMFTKATFSMKQDAANRNQKPEFRAVSDHQLVLPPA